jgi:hypothetical protein
MAAISESGATMAGGWPAKASPESENEKPWPENGLKGVKNINESEKCNIAMKMKMKKINKLTA